MILGVGMDVIRVARMEGELARDDGGFFDAVFTPAEIAACAGSARALASAFAAKEAAAKALGTGIRGDVSWLGIEVLQESDRARRIVWHGGALSRARVMGVRAVWVSCAANAEIAVACVVVEG